MHVEWMIMADSAEVVNGKLYLMGGGWDRLVVNQPFPNQQLISIAVSFSVGWDETNIRQPMEIRIEDTEGKQLARVNGEIEAGRPRGITPGQAQRVQLAFKLPLRFEKPDSFTVTAYINEEIAGRTNFFIAAGRQRQQGQQQRQQKPRQKKRKLDA
ncbi:MAG: hypothetical protein R3A46_14180 [Thermomicrobiales bacterium]